MTAIACEGWRGYRRDARPVERVERVELVARRWLEPWSGGIPDGYALERELLFWATQPPDYAVGTWREPWSPSAIAVRDRRARARASAAVTGSRSSARRYARARRIEREAPIQNPDSAGFARFRPSRADVH